MSCITTPCCHRPLYVRISYSRKDLSAFDLHDDSPVKKDSTKMTHAAPSGNHSTGLNKLHKRESMQAPTCVYGLGVWAHLSKTVLVNKFLTVLVHLCILTPIGVFPEIQMCVCTYLHVHTCIAPASVGRRLNYIFVGMYICAYEDQKS